MSAARHFLVFVGDGDPETYRHPEKLKSSNSIATMDGMDVVRKC